MSFDTFISDTRKHFYAKFGNDEYYFELSLTNNEGDILFLSRNAMMYLEIDDNIFNPFHSGTIIISDDNQVLEKNPAAYTFLGNGRDLLNLKIIPIKSGNFDRDYKDETNKEILGLEFHFVVIECKEITYNNALCKQLELVEWPQYALTENICNIFKLQKAGARVGNYLETNSGNAKSTGELIKSILTSVFTKNGNATDELFFRDPSGNKIIFEMDGNSVINIVPHGTVNYMEVLNYAMSFHTYKDSPCILQYDRYQKKYQLISLKTVFENHRDYVIETIQFQSKGSDSATLGSDAKFAINWTFFPFTFEESKIVEYNIDAPTCKYNVDLCGNSGILSNNTSFKTMIFNVTTLNSDKFMKNFDSLFVEPFRKEFEQYDVVPNFYQNPNKKDNFNTYKGGLSPALDEKKFQNQKLMSLLYLNNVYQFKLVGKTHRHSLSFVDVVKKAEIVTDKYEKSRWDMNNLGRHMITGCKHIFSGNTYYNVIETIKPYRLVEKKQGETIKDVLNTK